MPSNFPNSRDPSSLLSTIPQGADVLVIRLRSIGDVVLTTPALTALHEFRPDLRIRVLLDRFCKPLLEGNAAVTEVIECRGFWSMVGELRKRKFAIAYNLHGGPFSALLTGGSGAPVRVCWERRQYSFLYNVHAPDASRTSPMHTVEHKFQQLHYTGLPVAPLPAASVYPQPDAIEAVRVQLAEKGITASTRYAVLRPGASHGNKRWPVDKFVAIARWLREARGIVPIVNLGPADAALKNHVRQYLDPVAVRLDHLDLRHLIALLAGATLFVGNDTGPTHIAAALAKPCVVIFGGSYSDTWHPWRTEYRVVENKFPCEECPLKAQGGCQSFGESRCIDFVSERQVRVACEELLERRPL